MKFVPNIISIFRICLVPVFIIVYWDDADWSGLYAVIVYTVASISDILDGFLARKFKVSSKLGRILDPLGDKLMTLSVIICITVDGIIPVLAVIVVGIKEILMASGALVVHKIAREDIPQSNPVGKASTAVFFLVCVTLILFRGISDSLAAVLISIAIALTIAALAGYFITFIKVMKNRENK